MPLPETVAAPTGVPPLVQSLGGEDRGPNTVKVTVPVATLLAPDSVALTELGAIAVPAVPPADADTLVVVAASMPYVIVTDPLPPFTPGFDEPPVNNAD